MSAAGLKATPASGNPDKWINLLFERNLPNLKDITSLLTRLREMLLKEPNVLSVQTPVCVVGDIHGQFYDLLEVFKVSGRPPYSSYLFMGDYVDRGHYSTETVLLLFALKLRYPTKVHLIRGNHETRQITQVYGFYDECLTKFGVDGSTTWRLFCDVFDALPLCAAIAKETSECRFAVHAGLTPACDNFDQIQTLNRNIEVPHEGAMCDLVWSDPDLVEGWSVSPRGAGFVFGGDVVSQWNRSNGVKQICRSHQLVMVGYKEMFESGLVTVWSAPNYCYRCGNAAAVFEIENNGEANVKIFGPCPSGERTLPSEAENLISLPGYFL
eukprot:maker-scaffold_8-snap-gene-8.72-mRNA-1 protein AED:0.02 eAED:0.02 QI:0/1/0.5/1/1/1/2/42/325